MSVKDISMSKSFCWKLLERFSVQGSQFIIQVILARLLAPTYYGVLAIMMIFINLANVIIQNGFNTALIQNKEVDDDDFSTVFWLVLLISIIVYVVLFIAAPYLAYYYNMSYLENPFKVMALMLIPGALNSVQLAIIRRSMDFKKEFTSNVISIVFAGVVGIICAYNGLGLWSLVVNVLLHTTLSCITMWHVIGWRPRLVFDWARIKVLFSYGYKLVIAGLLDALSNDLSAFIIGIKYNAASLGFYTRGRQFPNAIMGVINSAVQSVMLPVLSMLQDDKARAKELMRKSMILSAFIVFPMMAGLAGIAEPMVLMLLTDKWVECVPYLQIFCFSFAFWPVHTSNLQAINAMGRSDIFLKLEVIKKFTWFLALFVAVTFFNTPLAIASMGIITTITSCFINCYPNKKILNYSYIEQMKDIFPYFFLSITMFLGLLFINDLTSNYLLNIIMQIIIGCVFYIFASKILGLEAYFIAYSRLKSLGK